MELLKQVTNPPRGWEGAIWAKTTGANTVRNFVIAEHPRRGYELNGQISAKKVLLMWRNDGKIYFVDRDCFRRGKTSGYPQYRAGVFYLQDTHKEMISIRFFLTRVQRTLLKAHKSPWSKHE